MADPRVGNEGPPVPGPLDPPPPGPIETQPGRVGNEGAPNPSPDNPPPTDTTTTTTDANAEFQRKLEEILALSLASGTKTVDPEVRAAAALYLKLWGVAPPPGYIEGLVKGGLNLYEIASNEMAKPAFGSTRSYKDTWAGYAQQVATLFGRR